MLEEDLHGRIGHVRPLPRQHLVEDRPEGVDVGSLVHGANEELGPDRLTMIGLEYGTHPIPVTTTRRLPRESAPNAPSPSISLTMA